MKEGKNFIKENNESYHRGIAEYDAFIKSGGKVKQGDGLPRAYIPGELKPSLPSVFGGASINKLNGFQRVRAVIRGLKSATMAVVQEHTKMSVKDIARNAKKLECDNLITRKNTSGVGVKYTWVGD